MCFPVSLNGVEVTVVRGGYSEPSGKEDKGPELQLDTVFICRPVDLTAFAVNMLDLARIGHGSTCGIICVV